MCAAAVHAGVAINPYVPGLAAEYMAPGLRTAPLRRLFEAHGADAAAPPSAGTLV